MWVMRKVSEGFRNTISAAIIAGDGVGKPSGLLHPNSGIPILDTAPATPEGQFTWQDLVQLKFDVPMQWHANGSYIMNQRTLGLLRTMSDAIGRPLLQWRAAYTLAQRSGTVMTPDPYSAQWCTLFRFEARVGGAVTCGNAARLLRIR